MFLQSCNFLELYASATNNFRVGAREKNNNITRNSSRFYILTLLTLLSADAKSGLYLRVSSLTKVEVRNFLLLHFPDGSVWFMDNLLCLCDVWKGRSYVNANVSVCLIFNNVEFYLKYYFLRLRNSLSKEYVSYKYVCKYLEGNIKSNFYIWIKFVEYSFSVSPRNKTTEFIQCHINFGETSQGGPNCVLEWALHRDVLGTSPGRQF